MLSFLSSLVLSSLTAFSLTSLIHLFVPSSTQPGSLIRHKPGWETETYTELAWLQPPLQMGVQWSEQWQVLPEPEHGDLNETLHLTPVSWSCLLDTLSVLSTFLHPSTLVLLSGADSSLCSLPDPLLFWSPFPQSLPRPCYGQCSS